MKKVMMTVGCAAMAMAAMAEVPVPSKATLSALDKGVIAIVHFGPNTFTGREWGYGDTPASVFNPPKLDAAQWVAAAKAGGIRRIVLVCKHHDGFCLWPSRYNQDYTVANTPWRDGRGDLVKEVRDATLAAGLEFGAYLSPWDRHHAEYARPAYTEYFHRQWAELMEDYGPISEIWLDGANGGDGWYGGAKETRKIPAAPVYYDHPRLLKALKAKYPLAAIFGMDTDRTLRWTGNERGIVPEEYDLVRNGVFQPPEADTPLRGKWFWHPGDGPKSLQELSTRYLESVGRSGILDLGLAPNRDGLIDDGDMARLKEFGDWVRLFNGEDLAKDAKCLVSYNSRKWSWILPEARTFDAIDLAEDIRKGLRVKSWKAFADDCQIAGGNQIGYRRIVRFASPVTAKVVRINIECDGKTEINLALRTIPPQDGSARNGQEQPAGTLLPYEIAKAQGGEFIADFGIPLPLKGFAFTSGEDSKAFPKGYVAYASDDVKSWRVVASGEFGNIIANPIKQDVCFDKPVTARYIKLDAVPFPGESPDWHAPGAKIEFTAP
ncbi:MAG: alpha-L-fucosidase [Kiritimatiellae bacterium]|nr:alpha-L-fucosidase [Kiritimatiellia bacterium]